MLSLGGVPASSTLYIPFHTFDANGASVTISGLAVTDIEIYKNGSTTQRSSDSGYALLDTDGIDFDGITGLHGFSIDLSDNTDAGFYSVGASYWVVVSAVTVNGQTVSFVAATFRIMAAESVAGKPKVDVDAFGGSAGTFASGRPEVNTSHISGSAVSTSSAQIGVNVVNAGGTAWASGSLTSGVFATGAITAGAIAADAIGASELAADAVAEIADAVWDEDATAHQTGGTFGQAIGDPGADTNTIFKAVVTDATGATVGVDVAAVLDDTGTSGVVVAADAITAAVLAADAGTEIGTAVWATATRTLTAIDEDSTTLDLDATIRAAVGLASANLDTQLDALPTAAENADAVWDEDATGHQTQGTFGQAIGDPAADTDTIWGLVNTNLNATVSSRASQTSVDTIDDFLDTEIAAIKAKTDQLTFTTANRVDSQVFGMEADTVTASAIATDAIGSAELAASAVTEIQTGLSTLDAAGVRAAVGLASANLDTQLDALPTNAELATALGTADDAVLAAVATVDTNVDAIKAKTDNLTFTSGQVDSNIASVKGQPVVGSGSETDPWGPA